MNKKHLKLLILVLSLSLFIASLTQKCYCTSNSCGDSLAALLVGIFGVFTGGAGLTWLANPLLFAAWIFWKEDLRFSLWASTVATAVSLSFLSFDTIMVDEAGHYSKIISYQAGYWLWVSSSMTMLLGNLFIRLKKYKSTP